jgi:hypothetical protein
MPGTQTVNSISVDLEVMTPDRLKRIIFGLDKSMEGEQVHWTIDFQYLQREKKTDEFGDPLVKLSVDVQTENHPLAEQTALKGLNSRQTDHLLGPAAIAARRLKEGKITEEKAAPVIERTLPKRVA